MDQYIIDAFTDKVFSGNPAAICILEEYPDDKLLQAITRENNLSETAFLVPNGNNYQLRWFTPSGEIDLCGHATLATSYVISQFIDTEAKSYTFETKSGLLKVTKEAGMFEMDFPSFDLKSIPVTDAMTEALGLTPIEACLGRDLICVLETEEEVRNLKPDIEKVKALDGLLLQVTAKGKDYDCISRTFAPKHDVIEDPVNGSGHCHIFPYWSVRLSKTKLVGYQASARGGVLYGEVKNNRVLLSGKAALYAKAEVFLN
ncbi:MAG: PhzF family phenazine biosynthesis protein [Micrococcaceae bacterium]